jgi:arylsulfatase A-like enzyme
VEFAIDFRPWTYEKLIAMLRVLLFSLVLSLTCDSRAERPNILFIFSDDHAEHAVSCYGSRVNQTPHIDRIAKEGVRFANAFVTNSICTPSRATLLTGQYSHINGVPVFNRFDGSKPHVAKLLQAAGYHTGVLGKWHLGTDPTGFDRWMVLPGQGVYRDPRFLVPGAQLTIEGYCTDITGDLGIEFLETRPKDKPFFLMLHQKAPHREWTPAERHREMFKDKVIPEPYTFWDDYATRPAALPENEQTIALDLTRRDLKLEPPAELKPGPERQKWLAEAPTVVEIIDADGNKQTLTGPALVKWKYQRYMQDYLACVQGVDDNIGKVLDYLDRTGLSQSTVVFYSSDNGFYLGDMGMFDKRFMYEPGLRVPLVVKGPGIKSGIVPEQFALNVDLAPTFLELAGEKIPNWMQGRSLIPLLHGENPADWRTSMYYRYYHDPGHHNTRSHLGVRTTTHKLIYYWKKDAWELYDLTSDPTEQRNVIDDPAQAAKVKELKTELARLQREFKDFGEFSERFPKDGVDKEFGDRNKLGIKSVAQAIAASVQK